MSIPKNIFQTHKSLIYLQQRKPKIVNAMRSWKFKSNEFNYYFYNNKMCDDFMKENFDKKIQRAYFKLPMGVMKADLWRYCIIYKHGGIYADADTVCKIDPNIFINNSYLTVAPEPPTHNYFCQWTFAAPANSPILKTIIDLSVERILNTEIKGEDIIHYLTGPACFTDGIQKYLKENNLPTYDNVNKYFKYPSHVLAVFNGNNFHYKFVEHLYAGSDDDGWKNEKKYVIAH
jgi:mannosyltransferase OCH1-like enzyme